MRGLVVAGIDHSPAARAALTWAADYARLIDARLLAVHVFPEDVPAVIYTALPTDDDRLRAHEYDQVTELFASIRPESDWRLMRTFGRPGEELVRLAEHADILVVGAQEHTGLRRLVLGSISHYCIRHAQVPVLSHPRPSQRVSSESVVRRRRLTAGVLRRRPATETVGPHHV
jgi:nucleotide-binding universal stress UspA family protein